MTERRFRAPACTGSGERRAHRSFRASTDSNPAYRLSEVRRADVPSADCSRQIWLRRAHVWVLRMRSFDYRSCPAEQRRTTINNLSGNIPGSHSLPCAGRHNWSLDRAPRPIRWCGPRSGGVRYSAQDEKYSVLNGHRPFWTDSLASTTKNGSQYATESRLRDRTSRHISGADRVRLHQVRQASQSTRCSSQHGSHCFSGSSQMVGT